jgi:hypothetical protein
MTFAQKFAQLNYASFGSEVYELCCLDEAATRIVYRLMALAHGQKSIIREILTKLLSRSERAVEIKDRWDRVCPIDTGLTSAIAYLKSIDVDFQALVEAESAQVRIPRTEAMAALAEFQTAIANELEILKIVSYGISVHKAYAPQASPLEAWVLEVELHRSDLPTFLVAFSGTDLRETQVNQRYRKNLLLGICGQLSCLREVVG